MTETNETYDLKQPEWRYFKNSTSGIWRTNETVNQRKLDGKWVTFLEGGQTWKAKDFIQDGFIETDERGIRLQPQQQQQQQQQQQPQQPTPPTRTPLSAETWPKTNLGKLLLAIVDKIGRPDGGGDGLYITRAIEEADATVEGVRDGK